MIELISIAINLITGIYILFVIPMRLNKIKKGIAAGLKDNQKIYNSINPQPKDNG